MMFDLQSVELRYGQTVALSELDLKLTEGEQVCLIGPSGAGKSSLLGLLNGRLPSTQGSVQVQGLVLNEVAASELRELRRGLAWIPQDLGLSLIHI